MPRPVLLATAFCLSGLGIPVAAAPEEPREQHGVQTRSAGAAIAPADAFDLLVAGNERFASGRAEGRNNDLERVRATGARGQNPLATVLTCSDSRVPVEYVLDRGVGDLFVIRVAGNVAGAHEAGSVEYAVTQLRTPVLIVLGHTGCGAVTAVCAGDAAGSRPEGHIAGLLAPIRPAAEAARDRLGPGAREEHVIDLAARFNVYQTIGDLLRTSPVIASAVARGELRVEGALYDVKTGRVEWMGPHPNQVAYVAATTGAEPAPVVEPKPIARAEPVVVNKPAEAPEVVVIKPRRRGTLVDGRYVPDPE